MNLLFFAKGRKKKTIEYVAVKSMDKSRRSKVFNEVIFFIYRNFYRKFVLSGENPE